MPPGAAAMVRRPAFPGSHPARPAVTSAIVSRVMRHVLVARRRWQRHGRGDAHMVTPPDRSGVEEGHPRGGRFRKARERRLLRPVLYAFAPDTTVGLSRTRGWRPWACGIWQAALSQEHHHRTPICKRGLEQVHSHEQREPQKIRVHVDAQQHTEGDKSPRDQTKRTFNSHDMLLSTIPSLEGRAAPDGHIPSASAQSRRHDGAPAGDGTTDP